MRIGVQWAAARTRRAATMVAQRLRPELWFLLFLAFGFVSVPWLRGDLIGQQAVVNAYTTRFFSVHQIRMGDLPSWNPYLLSGVPQLADISTAFFYPITVPLALVLPLQDAMNTWVVFHLMLAGSFMYLYLGTASLSRPARER